MTTVIDIIGGLIVGGLLMLIAMNALDNQVTSFFNYHSDAITQQNLTNLSNTIQYDMRKMGFGVPEYEKTTILQVASADRIKFLSHLNKVPGMSISGVGSYDDVADTIEYRFLLSETINVADTTLTLYDVQRTVTMPPNVPETMVIGQVGNNRVFRYLDQIGNEVAVTIATKMIEVSLSAFDPQIILTPDLVATGLSAADSTDLNRQLRMLLRTSYWRQTRLISRNLNR